VLHHQYLLYVKKKVKQGGGHFLALRSCSKSVPSDFALPGKSGLTG
jgi:hypothetical protein